MTEEASGRRRRHGTRIIGAVPAGVTSKVVLSLGQEIKDVFVRSGKVVEVKGMRFIPSTKVDLGDGAFEVMANTVVEVAADGDAPKRSQSVDSVVTVGQEGRNRQILRGVKIPSLDRLRA